MTSIRDAVHAQDWLEALADRTAQTIWVLDHEDDIDADFLAIYHLDLHEQEVTGPRYFALTHRLTAYQGVMAARAEEERERREPARSTTPTRTSSTPATVRDDSSTAELSLTQFRAKFPGLVSVGQGG
ncbi:MAG TPA: hypothetical protein VIP28_10560 [Nocardioides sp.]